MGGTTPRTVTPRVSDQRARGTSKGKRRVIVEAVGTDHGCDADGGKREHRVLDRKQDIHAEAMVEVGQMACGLPGIVLMRWSGIFVAVVVMMVHDQVDMFAVVLDESGGALMAVRDVREVTLRGTDGLPR